jgi:hypothetical protein
MKTTEDSIVTKNFHELLNTHGYSFQFSVIKEIQDYHSQNGRFPWEFDIAELPVEINGIDTRIDFILINSITGGVQLICECKRANPSLSNWCFARAPFIHKWQKSRSPITIERVSKSFVDIDPYSEPAIIEVTNNVYHFSFEIKTDQKGDQVGKGKGAIDDAITQVLRAYNGYINFLIRNEYLLSKTSKIDLIPIVITTATLWASEVDLSAANIETGNINLDTTALEKRKHIWLQHHLSNSIKHSFLINDSPLDLQGILDYQYLRTIAIVNSKYLKEFLIDLNEQCAFIKNYKSLHS